jgi:hypothetical protein
MDGGVGLNHFKRVQAAWLANRIPASPSVQTASTSRDTAESAGKYDFNAVPAENYDAIYAMLTDSRRTLKHRMPLDFVIKVLYHQWRNEDWFPTE